jgi:hypothetical protein
MRTRQRNRPVPTGFAADLLALDVGLSSARSPKPCARGPPSPYRRSHQRHRYGCGGSATSNPAGKDLPTPRPEPGITSPPKAKWERRCYNIASPERRTREASPSYS